MPADLRQPYDMREVIAAHRRRLALRRIQAALRHHAGHAASPISSAIPSGIIANNGILFSESALKGAHFIELCCAAPHPAGVPAEHHRLHGRPEIRDGRHRQGRRQAGHRGRHGAGAEIHRAHRRQLRRRQLRHVRPRLWRRASSGPGRTARISVMGGEQAASVLATVRRDSIERRGGTWPAEEEAAFKAPTSRSSSARATRSTPRPALGRRDHRPAARRATCWRSAFPPALNAPIAETRFGLFRM